MNATETAVAAAEPLQPITADQIEDDAPLSIKEHAAQFSPDARKAAEAEPPAEELKPIRPVDQQKRDQGKFANGQQRMRSKDAVERINQLTGRAKTAEEKLAAAETELAALRTQRAPAADIKQAEQKVARAETRTEPQRTSTFSEAEPDENDPAFAGDYSKYLRAVSAYEGRKAYHDAQHADRQAQQQQASAKGFAARVETVRQQHADFDAVAFGPTLIPEGSFVDAWISEHQAGPAVLYYLQSHRQEQASLLAKPVLQQADDLALLSQRLLVPHTSTQAGTTGSAAGHKPVVLPPKPPNPVRTEAQRASDGPPPMDGSLSLAEHSRAFGRTRR